MHERKMHVLKQAGKLLGIGLSLAWLLALVLAGAAAAADTSSNLVPDAGVGQDDLRINELMASNRNTLIDPDEPGETPDWIEIYNPGPGAVSLDGLGLADGEPLEDGFTISNGLSIPAGGFLIFYADNDPQQGPLHTNFALNADGESVILYRVATNAIIDRIDFPALGADVAYGRRPDGTGAPQILEIPTPGSTNDANPPRVTDVTSPNFPVAADVKFTVNATVTDTVGIAGVTLHYSMTGAGPQTTTMNLVGASLYAADIPAQANGILVTYYVEAVGTDGESGRAPVAGREFRYVAGYQAPQLLINEIVVKNDDQYVDPHEPLETPDWVELYNPGGVTVSLDGLSVSNDKDKPLKFRIFPGLSIPPGGRMMLLADDDFGQNIIGGNQPPLHMNFNLSKDDAFVGLYGGEGTVLIDSYQVEQEPLTGAIGRVPDGGEWSDSVCPSFNAANFLCSERAFMSAVRK
jgi:hypothetical protein